MIIATVDFPTFNRKKGRDFIARLNGFHKYMDLVTKEESFLYNRIMLTGPATEVLAQDDNKSFFYGVNYASADYLGMAQHPLAKKAAIEAIKKYGICSGNTPANLGAHEYLSIYLGSIFSFRKSLRNTGTCTCLSTRLDGWAVTAFSTHSSGLGTILLWTTFLTTVFKKEPYRQPGISSALSI